ncbi:hypothetical protein MtrunA17_Chr7g0229931 [Medicago truncatula]|uniref:Uncharacterized protein n=1 Tax=Medicago truncatula TaxID=3880 RepID=I3S1P7_MEDTR|nr:unknown [Medicago truncatula]RHN45359.1 hypothetical protein MtrunA17_Chr7g0229931 [Medicago truncatula]
MIVTKARNLFLKFGNALKMFVFFGINKVIFKTRLRCSIEFFFPENKVEKCFLTYAMMFLKVY